MAAVISIAEDLTVIIGVRAALVERDDMIKFKSLWVFRKPPAIGAAWIGGPYSLTPLLKLPACYAGT